MRVCVRINICNNRHVARSEQKEQWPKLCKRENRKQQCWVREDALLHPIKTRLDTVNPCCQDNLTWEEISAIYYSHCKHWRMLASTPGLMRLNGCSRRFWDAQNMVNSFGSMETKPFVILTVSMRSPNKLLYWSENSLKLHKHSVCAKLLNLGGCLPHFLDDVNVSNASWRSSLGGEPT